MAKAKKKKVVENLVITPPNFLKAQFRIVGTSPYVQHKFSAKARKEILEAQKSASGTRGKKKKPRDVEEDYQNAMHMGEDGKHGIPAPAIRSAMIAACRATGFVMTKARMSVFCLADTIDSDDGTPLIHIDGTPEKNEQAVRLESGVASIAIRPMWRKWSTKVTIEWDGDQFGISDIANLLSRAGLQIGIGEGRPFSKKSNGIGWGTFVLDPKWKPKEKKSQGLNG